MERQMDYDVVPCDVLRQDKAAVENGLLCIGGVKYPCMVLPESAYLERRTAEFIVRAAEQGLKVFMLGEIPGRDTEGKAFSEGFFDKCQCIPLDRLADSVLCREQELGLRRLAIEADAGARGLRSLILEQEEGLSVMLFNENVNQRVSVRIKAPGGYRGDVTEYNLWSRSSVSYRMPEKGFHLALEPGETAFLRFWRQGCTAITTPGAIPECAEKTKLSIDWRLCLEDWGHVGCGCPDSEEKKAAVGGQAGPNGRELMLKAGEPMANLNGPGFFPSFVGICRYEGTFTQMLTEGSKYMLYLPEASDSVRVVLNGKDLGWFAGFPARVDITEALVSGENRLTLEVANTPVWEIKDGASTHLQLRATGITEPPVVERY